MTENNISSCELALWDIASWTVRDEERRDELSRIFDNPMLNGLERRALCEKFAGEIFSDNVNDSELQELLNHLGTHPSARLSGMRSALVHVGKGYSAFSSIDPVDWFDRYREMEFARRSALPGTTDMAFTPPATSVVNEEVMA